MKRKIFLGFSSALLAAPLLQPISTLAQQQNLQNWSGNFTFSTNKVSYPATVAEVQQLVKQNSRMRPLGTRHCFNRIADSRYHLVSTKALNNMVALNEADKTVTVQAGIKYGELAPWLHQKGYALANLASLPHISVAGSCATATHGSGVKNKNLSAAVTALEMVVADGSIVRLSRKNDGEQFLAAVVGLGALGVVTTLTLQVEPTFMMRQFVFLDLPMSELKNNFEAIVSAGYSVSLFTDWQQESINEVWIKSQMDNERDFTGVSTFFGAKAAVKNMHPIAHLSAENCTEQMGVPGPWYERLPHFKMGFTPSSGKELQAEYFIPFQQAVNAINAIQQLGSKIGPYLFISEIRTIAADDFWMSPCNNQASVAIHFTWKQEIKEVMALLPVVEQALAPFHAKPHWGKLFTMPTATLASLHKKMEDFKKVRTGYDPGGKFINEFVEENLGV